MNLFFRSGKWSVVRIVFFLGGSIVLASVLLGYFVSSYFFLLTGFVGAMQIIFAITGFCPSAMIIRGLGAKCEMEQ